MQSTVFDANAFMETNYRGGLDTTYINPDPGDYNAQITDKIAIRQGIGDDGRPWASLDITWELLSAEAQKKCNMEHVNVRQSFFLDLDEAGRSLDLGPNRNMRLKRLLDATGLNKAKGWTVGALKFQTAFVHVEIVADRADPEILYANVTRVTSPDKARAAA